MAREPHPDWLRPEWAAPGVGALMTTRRGGVSGGDFDSLNLKAGLGDDDVAVRANQARLREAIGAEPVWLDQVHGRDVVRLGSVPASRPCADASLSTEPGVACVVQVADCLPVLFAAPGARGVAAAHAGWRGLAGGVLEATLAALCEATGAAPQDIQVWLGACIGPRQFEVGPDVLRAFGADPTRADTPCFMPHHPGKWLADLPSLARDRLQAAGAEHVSGGRWCTVEDRSRFFSFRRDGRTGRMAAAVWIEPRR